MEKPVPEPNADSAAYWAASAEGRLVYQACTECGRAQYYPRALCVTCGSRSLDWRESKGEGTIHAFTEVHVGLASFKEDGPYAIALIDLDEGFRMLTNVFGDFADGAIGQRVRVTYEKRGDISLPQFGRA